MFLSQALADFFSEGLEAHGVIRADPRVLSRDQSAIGQAQRAFRPLQGAAGGDGPGHHHRQQGRTGAFHMYLDDP